MSWEPGGVSFESSAGDSPAGGEVVIGAWRAESGAPRPGGENVRMNLWLFRGEPPEDAREVEVVVKRFEFVGS